MFVAIFDTCKKSAFPLKGYILFSGKRLYTCKTAADSFHTILETLGGSKEKERAKSLMENVTVVPDNPSFRTVRLPSTGKIKPRSKVNIRYER